MADRRLDPTFVRRQIELLRVTHPEIWDDGDDDELRELALESETGLYEFMAKVVANMADANAVTVGLGHLIENMTERRERFLARRDAMRSLAFKLMQQAGLRKLQLTEATLSIRAGTPKVIVTDEAALPPDCVRMRTEPDRVAIKERLARGEPVAGAEMSNAEPTLAVRVK